MYMGKTGLMSIPPEMDCFNMEENLFPPEMPHPSSLAQDRFL